MAISNKHFLHCQRVAQQSLDKFKRIVLEKKPEEIHRLVVKDWEAFIEDNQRLQRYIDHVDDAGSIFGFSRELSSKLTYEELVQRVVQRFAEIDLAEHIIRELDLTHTGEKLEKIQEGIIKSCDFRLNRQPPCYFESKYTQSITITKLTTIVEEALEQIKNSMELTGIGCVWIFTYERPKDMSTFHNTVMKIKQKFSNIGFDFKLNVQTYGCGLYGDTVVI